MCDAPLSCSQTPCRQRVWYVQTRCRSDCVPGTLGPWQHPEGAMASPGGASHVRPSTPVSSFPLECLCSRAPPCPVPSICSGREPPHRLRCFAACRAWADLPTHPQRHTHRAPHMARALGFHGFGELRRMPPSESRPSPDSRGPPGRRFPNLAGPGAALYAPGQGLRDAPTKSPAAISVAAL